MRGVGVNRGDKFADAGEAAFAIDVVGELTGEALDPIEPTEAGRPWAAGPKPPAHSAVGRNRRRFRSIA